jgi:hypothetical protein
VFGFVNQRQGVILHCWFLNKLADRIQLVNVRIEGEPLGNKDLEVLRQFLKRRWRSRIWVQQKVILARTAAFHCGLRSIDRESIFQICDFYVLDELQFYSKANYRHFGNSDRGNSEGAVDGAMQPYRRSRGASPLETDLGGFENSVYDPDDLRNAFESLYYLESLRFTYDSSGSGEHTPIERFMKSLNTGRFLCTSDPRDTIYGFLGFANEFIARKLEPNYDASVEEIFQHAAVELIKNSGSLMLFAFTQYTAQSHHILPSWVPNWCSLSTKGIVERNAWRYRIDRIDSQLLFSASGNYKLRLEIINRDTLKLSGAHFDLVSSLIQLT